MNLFKIIRETKTVQHIQHDLGVYTANMYVNAVMMLYKTGKYTCLGSDLEYGKIRDILFELFGDCKLMIKHDDRANTVFYLD